MNRVYPYWPRPAHAPPRWASVMHRAKSVMIGGDLHDGVDGRLYTKVGTLNPYLTPWGVGWRATANGATGRLERPSPLLNGEYFTVVMCLVRIADMGESSGNENHIWGCGPDASMWVENFFPTSSYRHRVRSYGGSTEAQSVTALTLNTPEIVAARFGGSGRGHDIWIKSVLEDTEAAVTATTHGVTMRWMDYATGGNGCYEVVPLYGVLVSGWLGDGTLAAWGRDPFWPWRAHRRLFYVRRPSVEVAAAAPPALTLTQSRFRWRNDDGSESGATWDAAEDTNLTVTPGSTRRIRIQVAATSDPASKTYKVQIRKTGTTPWKDATIE